MLEGASRGAKISKNLGAAPGPCWGEGGLQRRLASLGTTNTLRSASRATTNYRVFALVFVHFPTKILSVHFFSVCVQFPWNHAGITISGHVEGLKSQIFRGHWTLGVGGGLQFLPASFGHIDDSLCSAPTTLLGIYKSRFTRHLALLGFIPCFPVVLFWDLPVFPGLGYL